MWRSWMSKLVITAVVAVVANVVMVDDAVAATYAPPGYYNVSGFTTGCLFVRSQPNTSSSSSACLALGTSVYLSCAVRGDTINGDPYWDRARDYGGWVSDNYMNTPYFGTQTLPPCPPTSYQMKALVVRYFPLVSGTNNVDSNETQVSCANGQVFNSANPNSPCTLSFMESYVGGIANSLAANLTSGSKFHGYSNASAPASLTYSVAATVEHTSKVPRNQSNSQRPDYPGILSGLNICNYMLQNGVNEVWIFAYQSSALNQIDESKMSGPNGDVSNELQHDNLPVCGRTYTVYTFNYGRTVAEAMESHGHQYEAELNWMNHSLFSLFEQNDLTNPGQTTHCGTVHNPPNAGFEHDYGDVNGVLSDCQEFLASGGPDYLSCIFWSSCSGNIDTDEPHYLVWWMQNFPGLGNQATYQGRSMRNWWDVHGDWDLFIWRGGSLLN